MKDAIALLREFDAQLPRGHHEKPGIKRAIEVLQEENRRLVVASLKPLRFHRSPNPGQYHCLHTETGLYFVLTHVDSSDGERKWEIEISAGPGSRVGTEVVERYDVARARCTDIVRDRLLGRDGN